MPQYTLVFPDGITSYYDRSGALVTPGETGVVQIDASLLREYLEAGFVLVNSGLAELVTTMLRMQEAMAGDMVFVVTPATVDRVHGSSAWSRTVTVELQNAAGEVHDWFDADLASGVSIADTSTAGTASIPSTTLEFLNGRATVVVSGDAVAWLATETDTLTVEEAEIMGYTVAEKTSVQTFT
jgi:hypothetical protein